jgi:hypothetical protein
MSLTKASYSMTTGAVVNVLDYGATGNGITNDTAGIQAAIDAAQGTQQVFFPAGVYKVTSTLNLYKGSNLIGVNESQGWWEYASGFTGTKILFAPTVESDLFDVQNLPAPTQNFLGHVSVGGMYIQGDGDGTTPGYARRAFNLDTVIYGNFFNLEIIYFWSAFLCTDTINNRFSNIRMASCTTSCVEYSGSAPPTTDVWDLCTFQIAPIGVRFASGGIGVRFAECLFEALSFGAVIEASCQNIEFIGCYSEDVPSVNDASLSMFQVGNLGTDSQTVQLRVVGGIYQGRNAGVVGTFLDVYKSTGVQLIGCQAARYTNFINTAASTQANAVFCAAPAYLSCTNFANNEAKLCGSYPVSAINANNGLRARFGLVKATLGLESALLQNTGQPILSDSSEFGPATDNVTTLGSASRRWTVVYATTGTINTSDARSKVQDRPLSDAEKAVAVKVKGLLKAFKFADAVESKGDKARIHFGVYAQEVALAFESEGLNADDYGLFCYDEWEANPAVLDENGVEVTPATEAGNRFGIRYEELLAFVLTAI